GRVAYRPGIEVKLSHVVDYEVLRLLLVPTPTTLGVQTAVEEVFQISTVAAVFQVCIDGAVTQILAHRQEIVEAMLEFVADTSLLGGEVVPVGIALIDIRYLTIRGIIEEGGAARD